MKTRMVEYTENNYDDLTEKFIKEKQEEFDAFCMNEWEEYEQGQADYNYEQMKDDLRYRCPEE